MAKKKKFPNLQKLIATAGVNRFVRLCLFNEHRQLIAEEFSLSQQERNAIFAIEATTFQGFAQGLQDWMAQQEV
jgi:hypothetical protein